MVKCGPTLPKTHTHIYTQTIYFFLDHLLYAQTALETRGGYGDQKVKSKSIPWCEVGTDTERRWESGEGLHKTWATRKKTLRKNTFHLILRSPLTRLNPSVWPMVHPRSHNGRPGRAQNDLLWSADSIFTGDMEAKSEVAGWVLWRGHTWVVTL